MNRWPGSHFGLTDDHCFYVSNDGPWWTSKKARVGAKRSRKYNYMEKKCTVALKEGLFNFCASVNINNINIDMISLSSFHHWYQLTFLGIFFSFLKEILQAVFNISHNSWLEKNNDIEKKIMNREFISNSKTILFEIHRHFYILPCIFGIWCLLFRARLLHCHVYFRWYELGKVCAL